MEQNDKMKDARRSLNARLLLLAVGIMLVVNAAVSSLRTGISWVSLADLVTKTQLKAGQTEDQAEAEAETEVETEVETETETQAVSEEDTEFDIQGFIQEMNRSGLTAGDIRSFGIFFLISAVLEIIVGMICAVLSNRVDKSKITFIATVILAIWELIFVVYLLLRGGLMLSVLLNSILLPLVLLWNAWQMRKMAKADPTRIFAVKPNRAPVKKESAPAPKKSIKDRVDWASTDREE